MNALITRVEYQKFHRIEKILYGEEKLYLPIDKPLKLSIHSLPRTQTSFRAYTYISLLRRLARGTRDDKQRQWQD